MIKRQQIILFLMLVSAVWQQAVSQAERASGISGFPEKSEVIDKMKLVNDYYISGKPSPGDNKWVKAVYFTGCMEFYKIYPDKAYLDYMNLWAETNSWALSPVTDHDADNQICGQTYIDLYNMDDVKQASKIQAIKARMDNLVANSSAANDDWFWVDAFYMAMPVFTKLGLLYPEAGYVERMYSMYRNTKDVRKLYDANDHLWFRDNSQTPPTYTPSGKKCYWSRGNGWVLAAYARVLRDLPADSPLRNEFIQTFTEMAESLKARQRSDGFWNVSLADPNDYGGPEASGTALFCYGMSWGINNGILDAEAYAPVVLKAWNGLISLAVQSNGFLGYVQGAGYKPSSSQPVTAGTTAEFGVGAFLLAGSEMVKLAQGEMPVPSVEASNVDVTASSYEEGTDNTPDKTIDRNFSTRWSAEGVQWIRYDLQEVKNITSVDIAFYQGNTRKTYFSIEFSTNGEDFIPVFNGESGGKTANWESFPFDAQPARYVKITGSGNSKNQWNSLSEVRINAKAATAIDPANIESGMKALAYPNPLTGSSLTLRTGEAMNETVGVELMDLTGKRMISQLICFAGNELKIENLHLPAGMYIVSLCSRNNRYTDMLIVK
jgi:rhamnogalacturonyl hydrolase YesR